MLEVFSVALQIALGIALPVWVIRRDLRQLGPERLSRAWPDASIWSAVAAFGPLSLVVHFARTRRSLLGFGLGIGWAAMALLAGALVAELGALGK
ncbi:MAG: hypothetical protein M3020_22610 [Myxococcota bacterium]|nr:hypothetical protein [Myxococcota bacterium]